MLQKQEEGFVGTAPQPCWLRLSARSDVPSRLRGMATTAFPVMVRQKKENSVNMSLTSLPYPPPPKIATVAGCGYPFLPNYRRSPTSFRQISVFTRAYPTTSSGTILKLQVASAISYYGILLVRMAPIFCNHHYSLQVASTKFVPVPSANLRRAPSLSSFFHSMKTHSPLQFS